MGGTPMPRKHSNKRLIDVTPAPVFAGLERTDDGVLRGVEVFGRVLVLGGVAAADVAADSTDAEVDPLVAELEALLAAVRRARRKVADLVSMGAAVAHESSLVVLLRLGHAIS